MAARRGITLFGATKDAVRTMAAAGVEVAGGLDDLLSAVDVVVDCTPKGVGAENASRYREAGVRFVVQGGEKHDVTGHSFVADANYASTVGRESTRVVSCNTTSIVRTLTALKVAGLLDRARGILLRRVTDPWESHLGGIMNTLVPETSIPSYQAPDARTVDPDLDVVTQRSRSRRRSTPSAPWRAGIRTPTPPCAGRTPPSASVSSRRSPAAGVRVGEKVRPS